MKLKSIKNKLSAAILLFGVAILAGCASVPMVPKEQSAISKLFTPPPSDKAGIYIFRNGWIGQAVKRTVSIDGSAIGQTANKTFFYKIISPGSHTLSTESEFSDNTVTFQAEGGKNSYARQYMKMGVFITGAGIEMVSEEEGRQEVIECEQAQAYSN